MNGRTYGNNGNGYGYSPNRRYDVDRFNNNRSTFTNASGNRVNGYYSNPYMTSANHNSGEWVQSGSGMWFKR